MRIEDVTRLTCFEGVISVAILLDEAIEDGLVEVMEVEEHNDNGTRERSCVSWVECEVE